MATEKILNTRIKLRHDTYDAWHLANPTLLKGEIAIVELPSNPANTDHGVNPPATLIKVGPGSFNSLPFLSATAADVHSWAKKSEEQFKEWVKTLVTVADIDAYSKGEVDNLLNGKLDKTTFESFQTTNTAAIGTAKSEAIADAKTETTTQVNALKNGEVKANADAIAAIKDGTTIDSFADVESALSGKVDNGTYAQDKATFATKTEAQGYANAKDEAIAAAQKTADDITAYVGTFTTSEGVDTVVKYIDAKTANIASDERVNGIDNRVKAIEKDYLVEADIANFETKENVTKVADDLAAYVESNDAALAGVKATADAAAVKTEVEAALALKADKSVVDAMYTNDQINGLIAEAKKYADDNDADTKYGITYDSDNKKIKLVEGGTNVEIDASAFIKDGMINTVTIDENDDLIITFNTDSGKENIVLPLDQLVDIYTGVQGDRIKVTVNADKSISADLIAGSISKDYLDNGVKASLALADSALQSHQDISHLATKNELKNVDDKFASYTTTKDLNTALALKADKTQVATDIAAAKSEVTTAFKAADAELAAAIEAAKTEASNQGAVVLAEAQAYADQAKADAIATAAEDAAAKYEKIGVAQGLVNELEGELAAIAKTGSTDDLV